MFFHFFKKNIIKTNENSFVDEKASDFIDVKINLDVSKENIIYRLDWFCCYKELTGTCSLDLEEPIKEYLEKCGGYSSSYDFCRTLAMNIKVKKTASIEICKYKDNTCKVTDGQHRACICQKLKLKHPAYFCIPKSMLKNYKEFIIDSFL